MTNEEKARAYDEALERARKQKDDYQKELNKADKNSQLAGLLRAGISAIELAFPQLKESEDERIIRAIDEAIKDAHVNTLEEYGSSCKEARAWLKTQLEKQKPATFYVPDDADLSHPRNKFAFMLGQYRKQGHINEEEYWQMLKYLIEKEPKSSQTDTEKEYVRTLKSLISDFLHGKQEIDTEYYQQIYDWLDEIHIEQKVLPGFDGLTPEEKMNHPLYLEGFDVGRDVQKVFDEQKPAEWGEEDEKQIAQIERIVKNAGCTKMLQEKIHIWLKSLRPSWKPSEQEKGALRTAIHVLTEERNFPKAAGHLQAILDAFDGKEARKEWKPSEEQMEAVQYVSQFDYGGHKATLVSLYEQLKKL